MFIFCFDKVKKKEACISGEGDLERPLKNHYTSSRKNLAYRCCTSLLMSFPPASPLQSLRTIRGLRNGQKSLLDQQGWAVQSVSKNVCALKTTSAPGLCVCVGGGSRKHTLWVCVLASLLCSRHLSTGQAQRNCYCHLAYSDPTHGAKEVQEFGRILEAFGQSINRVLVQCQVTMRCPRVKHCRILASSDVGVRE